MFPHCVSLRGRGWVWREAYLAGLLCTKLFSNELTVGSAPERGQTERKEGLCPHTGPMQPVFGNWDLAPDQIPARLLLNLLVGAAAVCDR